MKNFVSIQLLMVSLILLGVREIPARGLNQEVANYRQPKAASTVTVTVLSTTTSSTVTTSVFTTKKICFSLSAASDGNTPAPAVTCRKRRDANWYHANVEPLLYVVYGDDGEQYNIHPSPVLRFEQTALPEFRANSPPAVMSASKKVPATPVILQQHQHLQPSFEKTPDNIRIAQPIYFGGLSSIISSVVSNILTSTTTITSVVTAYTSTSVSTSYSASFTVTLVGTCYPASITTCA